MVNFKQKRQRKSPKVEKQNKLDLLFLLKCAKVQTKTYHNQLALGAGVGDDSKQIPNQILVQYLFQYNQTKGHLNEVHYLPFTHAIVHVIQYNVFYKSTACCYNVKDIITKQHGQIFQLFSDIHQLNK